MIDGGTSHVRLCIERLKGKDPRHYPRVLQTAPGMRLELLLLMVMIRLDGLTVEPRFSVVVMGLLGLPFEDLCLVDLGVKVMVLCKWLHYRR